MEKMDETTLQELREMLSSIVEAAIAVAAERVSVAVSTAGTTSPAEEAATCEDAPQQEKEGDAEEAAAPEASREESEGEAAALEEVSADEGSQAERTSDEGAAAARGTEIEESSSESGDDQSSDGSAAERALRTILRKQREERDASVTSASTETTTSQWSVERVQPLRRPVAKVAATTSRPSAQDAWATLEGELREVRDARRRANAIEREAFEKFDAYIRPYGAEGEDLTGKWVQLIRDHRNGRRVADEWVAEEKKRCRASEEALAAEREARRKLQELARLKEEQQHAENETRRQLNLALEQQRAALSQPARRRYCPVCGYAGVSRGRECPKRETHPGWKPR